MKRSLKTTVIFSLVVFTILVITMLGVGLCMMLLFRIGIMPRTVPGLQLLVFAGVSIVVGTGLSRVLGHRLLKTIIDISEATKQVAHGDFDVKLDEDIPAEEFRIMARNFNRMAQELQQIEMFRNDFISNVSHEFRTPLTAIEGYVALLQNPNLSPEKQKAYSQKILTQTHRLSALTGNVLLLSRLENQEFTMQTTQFSLDEQLRESILLYEKEWNEKRITMDVELIETDYMGNQELLSHVWQNLLGNAIKFVQPGGRICVALNRAAEGLRVTVADDGVGMSEAVMSRIYEKFYQGDRSHSTSGNGLGLTLAKRIVDLHGGAITASSQEGVGTIFTVLLPYKTT